MKKPDFDRKLNVKRKKRAHLGHVKHIENKLLQTDIFDKKYIILQQTLANHQREANRL